MYSILMQIKYQYSSENLHTLDFFIYILTSYANVCPLQNTQISKVMEHYKVFVLQLINKVRLH